ncbi:glycosyltransferase family A protein [Moraxella sp. ZY210820]|uniref:glycosyltransferase family 2 protein n=1 Tax=unclassified Moraxella TaxID=2685852 RepID=UPI0027318120|nr:glycosyltransferase family A protein [Moraxella sp. ZY210820]WLF83317.1 glycosyltransferase family 2 protein [Moraxella sp. ZY210820]
MTTILPTLDVIIPCYNASSTIERAIISVLPQNTVQHLYIVNDGSTDDTWQVLQQLQAKYQSQYPHKIILLNMPYNNGVATARNWGALHSQADLIAFLDADDAYQSNALSPIPTIFQYLPTLSVLKLRLIPIDLADKYSQHSDFHNVWNVLQNIGAGNSIFRRSLFLACGGFPQHELFKKFGGEDACLSHALERSTMVGSLFAPQHMGVLNYCRTGMHAERLLNAYLFNVHDQRLTQHEFDLAEQLTQNIVNQLNQLKPILNYNEQVGRREILIEYAPNE